MKIPFLIIRYVSLKQDKDLSKRKAWSISGLCVPLTSSSILYICNYVGDGAFYCIFVLLAFLIISPLLVHFWLLPKVRKLEEEIKKNLNFHLLF